MQGADDVEAANHQIHEVVDLGVKRLLQLLEGVQLGELAGLGAELLAVDGVDAVVHHQLNALEHVDVADSGTAVGAAGDAGLDAAVDTPVAGLLDGAAVFSMTMGTTSSSLKNAGVAIPAWIIFSPS